MSIDNSYEGPQRALAPLEPISLDAKLVHIWEEAAMQSTAPPEYEGVIEFNDFLSKHRPGTFKRIQQRLDRQKPLRRGQQRVLNRYKDRYPGYLEGADNRNQKIHNAWRLGVASVYAEAYGLSLLSNDKEELAREALERTQTWCDDDFMGDTIGLALLATGEPEKAKSVILGARSDDNRHLQDVLDAYIHTGDEDYRRDFIAGAATSSPYLLARLVLADYRHGKTAEGVLRAASSSYPARAAVAATILSSGSPESAEYEAARDAIDDVADYFQVPKKRAPMGSNSYSLAWDLGNIFDASTLDLEKILGPLPEVLSPQYVRFIKKTATTMSILAPLLEAQNIQLDRGLSSIDNYNRSNRVKILVARSDWGDTSSAVKLLGMKAGGRSNQLSVYRNALRDIGPESATKYIASLPESVMRPAAYYTLVTLVLKGATNVSSPSILPDLPEDEFAKLTDLYASVGQLAEGALDVVDAEDSANLAVDGIASLIDVTDLSNSRSEDIDELLSRIRTINDHSTQRVLLERLIKKLASS